MPLACKMGTVAKHLDWLDDPDNLVAATHTVFLNFCLARYQNVYLVGVVGVAVNLVVLLVMADMKMTGHQVTLGLAERGPEP